MFFRFHGVVLSIFHCLNPITQFHLYHVKRPANFSLTDLEFFPYIAQIPSCICERTQKSGQKRPFFALFFARFFLKNHYILWFKPLFFLKTTILHHYHRLNVCLSYYVNTIFQPRHLYRNTITYPLFSLPYYVDF